MTVKVLLFGPIAAAAGASECIVRLGDDRSSAAVLHRLGEDRPAIRPLLAGARLAINSAFAAPQTPVAANDELAVIGLVSGG